MKWNKGLEKVKILVVTTICRSFHISRNLWSATANQDFI